MSEGDTNVRWAPAGLAGLVAALALVGLGVVATADSAEGQQSDVAGQGGSEPALADGGATLVRDPDGLRLSLSVPTPEAGSYEYPSGDQIADWSPVQGHPEVVAGGPDEPEVFTVWMVVFNHPSRCTDGACDRDDFREGAAAKGGMYQADGRVADEADLEATASIRLGQVPLTGAPMENPLGAEVHVAIAPHGKAVAGAGHWVQLNSPLGNPSLWWAATFPAE